MLVFLLETKGALFEKFKRLKFIRSFSDRSGITPRKRCKSEKAFRLRNLLSALSESAVSRERWIVRWTELRGGSISGLFKACASMYREIHLFDCNRRLHLVFFFSPPGILRARGGPRGALASAQETIHAVCVNRDLTDLSLFRCAPLSDCEAAIARLPALRPDVLMGVESAQASEDGLRHGHLRDALLLPVLPVQIADRGELPQASALGAQHQVDAGSGDTRGIVRDRRLLRESRRRVRGKIRPEFFLRLILCAKIRIGNSSPIRESVLF